MLVDDSHWIELFESEIFSDSMTKLLTLMLIYFLLMWKTCEKTWKTERESKEREENFSSVARKPSIVLESLTELFTKFCSICVPCSLKNERLHPKFSESSDDVDDDSHRRDAAWRSQPGMWMNLSDSRLKLLHFDETFSRNLICLLCVWVNFR